MRTGNIYLLEELDTIAGIKRVETDELEVVKHMEQQNKRIKGLEEENRRLIIAGNEMGERVGKLESLLFKMDSYLDINELTSIGSSSIFHNQIKELLKEEV